MDELRKLILKSLDGKLNQEEKDKLKEHSEKSDAVNKERNDHECKSLFLRDISFGCNQINQKIIDHSGCNPKEAESIKLKKNNDKIPEEDMHEIKSSVTSNWCTEIRRAFDFFDSTNPETRITKIALSGGGANIDEFRTLLSSQISAEVEMINPFKDITINNDKLDPGYLERVSPQSAICMGLAIRKVDDK